ncbi:hypothetical protein GCM10010299_25780 [Streptomyces tanashiensis]|nr:hypothetical protein GCM10010299_25780 [Streptomyces tanashiensis]
MGALFRERGLANCSITPLVENVPPCVRARQPPRISSFGSKVWNQGSVHDPQPVDVGDRPQGRLQGQQRTQAVDDPADGGRRDPEERGELPHGEVGPVGDGHQQGPVGQRKAPRPATTRTVEAKWSAS